MDTRLTEDEVTTVGRLRNLVNEVIAGTRNADSASLTPEAELRLTLRAVEIGTRAVAITDHKRRLTALVERNNE